MPKFLLPQRKISFYLVSFNTNYIIFRNVEISKKIVKVIFYLSKWKFQNWLIIWQTCVEAAKVPMVCKG
jgi:hypothetical protein